MKNQSVTKLYRQHTTVVTRVPTLVAKQLELNVGDFLVWQIDSESAFVQVSKVVAGGAHEARNKRNPTRKNRRRRT